MRPLLLFLAVFPACSDKDAPEPEDRDTETGIDDSGTDADGDDDGFDTDDCDDVDPDVHPGAIERCDEVDNDCDGTTDEDDAVDAGTWYQDLDGDGFGVADQAVVSCIQPEGYAIISSDCDDAHADAHPGATEVWYDGIDQDCEGGDDDDQDGDGHGVAVDCDDVNAAVHPGAFELCNDQDDDCDGSTDESAIDAADWYQDDDADGYGVDATEIEGCDAPKGSWASVGGDCADDDGARNPGLDEDCDDGVDNDCDLAIDNCRFSAAEAEGTLIGEAALDQAGFAVAPAGDLDGDGNDDVVVGAPGSSVMGKDAGAAYVVSGPVTGSVDLSTATARILGSDAGDEAGGTLAGGFDFDGDAVPDVVVGVPGHHPDAIVDGGVAVFFGPVSGELGIDDAEVFLLAEDHFDIAGASVAGAGDPDDDGTDDLLVGASDDEDGGVAAGAVYLVNVSAGEDLTTRTAKLTGEAAGDYAATALGPGDTDGDGIDDVVVGAYGSDEGATAGGIVYTVFGPVAGDVDLATADRSWSGETMNAYAGCSLARAGDQDGDGNEDIVVGAYGDDGFRGAAYVVSGGSASGSLADAEAKLVGEAAADFAGYTVSGGGDLNGDSVPDLAVGASGNDEAATSAGAVYLFMGPLSGTLDIGWAPQSIEGEAADAFLGWSVAFVGDVDADGLDDLSAGAIGLTDGGKDAGGAYLFLGSVDW